MKEAGRSRAASIASWLGKFAPSCALAGILGIQIGVIPPLGGYLFFMIGLLAALLAVGFGATGILNTRKLEDESGRNSAWLGLASGAAMITISLGLAGPGLGGPPINDISTDLDDPPAFAAPDDVPDFADRDMSYPKEFIPIVREAYPDLQPIRLTIDSKAAYGRSLGAVKALGWLVVHEDRAAGTIDARTRTRLFRFLDDVVIRIRGEGGNSIIDMRSKSRDGKGDVGTNAARIRAFREELEK